MLASRYQPALVMAVAGVALTSMVTLAGVGIALSGTALEALQRAGRSASDSISVILLALAAVLLAAAIAVWIFRRSENKSGAHPFG